MLFETLSRQLRLFIPIIEYYYVMDILMVMCIPNPIDNSLDAKYTVFSTITNFVSEMTLGHVVTFALR